MLAARGTTPTPTTTTTTTRNVGYNSPLRLVAASRSYHHSESQWVKNGSWESQRFDDSHACSARAGRATIYNNSNKNETTTTRVRKAQSKSFEVHLMHVEQYASVAFVLLRFFLYTNQNNIITSCYRKGMW